MIAFLQRVQEQAAPSPHLFEASGDLLSSLLVDLYRRASGQPTQWNVPIPVIGTTDVAYRVLKQADRFVKNYDFLHIPMPGRFSANGQDWLQKVRLTQGFYSAALKTVSATDIERIYTQNLLMHGWGHNVFEAYVSAAVEVVSKAFGIDQTIRWPADWVEKIRARMLLLQAVGWVAAPPTWRQYALDQLEALTRSIFELWEQDPQTMAFLKAMAAKAEGSVTSAKHELMQNLFAATETTASSLCWMLDILSRDEHLLMQLQSGTEADWARFIDETLRLYPPVPMVTRVCNAADPQRQDDFGVGDAMVVSIVGLHTQAQEWHEPMRFNPNRNEWKAVAPPKSFIPFLYGPRICGGRKLAKEELMVGLKATLEHFEIEPAKQPQRFKYSLTSRPYSTPVLNRKKHV
jgi:cytochrome P450